MTTYTKIIPHIREDRVIRQPIKIHGGKHYLAKWIISLMPPRDSWDLYREVQFGAGSVLLRMDPEGISETVNDIDGDLMNFWSVLQSPTLFPLFERRVNSCPLSQDFWQFSGEGMRHGGADERAAAFFVHARQSRAGLRKDFATPTQRLRRKMNENVSAWLSAVEGLPDVHERMLRVEVRNLDALDFIRKYDNPKAVFYCDPPYLHSERHGKGSNTDYRHEMTTFDHACLLGLLGTPYMEIYRMGESWSDTEHGLLRKCQEYELKGRFLLSGYHSEMYDHAAKSLGWRCEDREIDNKASSKKVKEKKFECVWMNY